MSVAAGGRAGRLSVCHVITKLELGGAQQNTLYTVGHLDRDLFVPSLICGMGGLLDDEAMTLDDVEVHFTATLRREVDPPRDTRALLDLARLLRTLAPDIVHTHSSKAGILGRWAAHLAGVPVIVHSIHGFGFNPSQRPVVRAAYVTAERITSRITTRFVAVSRANLEEGLRLGLFRRDGAVLIRSGIRLAQFRGGEADRGRLRAEIGAGPDTPVAGMIACLKPQKAPDDFVAAAARVAAVLPEARFVLAGDGELRPAVERLVRREGLEGKFHLLGWRRDIPAILRDIDVLVLTSRWEGLPRVFPEAMTTGRPIVACRVDGAPEAVHEGENGYLVEPGDVPAIARRMIELLGDRPLAARMGEAGRAAAAEWDIDDMVSRQEELYLDLAHAAGLAPPACLTVS